MDCPSLKRKRPNADHTYYKSEDSIEDFAEVVKFCGLTKGIDETMSTYYRRLKLNAAKVGINCCQDRIIRDRLIQAVTDADILLELSKMVKSPTAKDVLNKYNEMTGQSLLFDLIVPYLSLVDILAISRLSKRWNKIFERYIKDGKRITIDDDLIQKYPLETNMEMYSQFKGASNIAMRRLPESHVGKWFKYFSKIDILAIIQMTILSIQTLPSRNLTDLTICHSKIEKQILQHWLNQIPLDKLYLDNIQTEYFPYPNGRLELNFYNDHLLQNLRLRGQNIYLRAAFPELKTLTVVANEFEYFFEDCPNLEHLHYDVANFTDMVLFLKGDELYALQKRYFKSVKIVRSVDPKYKGIFDMLDLEKVEVEYLEYAKDNEPNNILRVLNEDCLINVIKFLTLDECLSFAKTHPRIEEIITRFRFTTFGSQKYLEKVLIRRPELISSIAPLVKHLEIGNDKDFLINLLPNCTGLSSLSLHIGTITRNMITMLPTSKLKRISLSGHTNSKDTNDVFNYFSKLRNIKEIEVETTINSKWIELLFKANSSSLEHVSLVMAVKQPIDKLPIDWQQLRKLKSLKLTRENASYCAVHINDKRYLSKVLNLLDSRLMKLTLKLSPKELADVIHGAKMEHIHELELLHEDDIEEIHINALCSLKKLQKLTLRLSVLARGMSNDVFTKLIFSCPKLTHLGISKFNSDFRFEQGLNKKLRELGRKIEFRQMAETFQLRNID